ncbi:MAG: hypothetical protein IPI04_16090 [Ignavibacteria bacterium]|nr:hypothetical protein [Ignavibacteria bacterium]
MNGSPPGACGDDKLFVSARSTPVSLFILLKAGKAPGDDRGFSKVSKE